MLATIHGPASKVYKQQNIIKYQCTGTSNDPAAIIGVYNVHLVHIYIKTEVFNTI